MKYQWKGVQYSGKGVKYQFYPSCGAGEDNTRPTGCSDAAGDDAGSAVAEAVREVGKVALCEEGWGWNANRYEKVDEGKFLLRRCDGTDISTITIDGKTDTKKKDFLVNKVVDCPSCDEGRFRSDCSGKILDQWPLVTPWSLVTPGETFGVCKDCGHSLIDLTCAANEYSAAPDVYFSSDGAKVKSCTGLTYEDVSVAPPACKPCGTCPAGHFRHKCGLGDKTSAICNTYEAYMNKNAYTGNGATDLDGGVVLPAGTAEDCKLRCEHDPDCDCVVFQKDASTCFKRTDCDPSGFANGNTAYDTYVKNSSRGCNPLSEGECLPCVEGGRVFKALGSDGTTWEEDVSGNCPAGTFYTPPSTGTILCNDGTATNNPHKQCKACTAGNYCPSNGGANSEVACPAGFFSDATGATSEANCAKISCPARSFCLEGTTSCTGPERGCIKPCGAGYITTSGVGGPRVDLGATACTICPAGSVCADSSKEPTPCPAGFACAEGVTSTTACTSSALSCKNPIACNTGYYTADVGATACTICPAGSVCADSSKVPTPCPAGFACAEGVTSTTACTSSALSCKNPIACNAGYYTANSSCVIGDCNFEYLGDYTDGPSTFATTGATHCAACIPGFTCAGNANRPTPTAPGSYSAPGAAISEPCVEGSCCPGGTKMLSCDSPECSATAAVPRDVYCPAKSASAVPVKKGFCGVVLATNGSTAADREKIIGKKNSKEVKCGLVVNGSTWTNRPPTQTHLYDLDKSDTVPTSSNSTFDLYNTGNMSLWFTWSLMGKPPWDKKNREKKPTLANGNLAKIGNGGVRLSPVGINPGEMVHIPVTFESFDHVVWKEVGGVWNADIKFSWFLVDDVENADSHASIIYSLSIPVDIRVSEKIPSLVLPTQLRPRSNAGSVLELRAPIGMTSNGTSNLLQIYAVGDVPLDWSVHIAPGKCDECGEITCKPKKVDPKRTAWNPVRDMDPIRTAWNPSMVAPSWIEVAGNTSGTKNPGDGLPDNIYFNITTQPFVNMNGGATGNGRRCDGVAVDSAGFTATRSIFADACVVIVVDETPTDKADKLYQTQVPVCLEIARKCAPGSHSVTNDGNSPCVSCPEDTYQDMPGKSACISCRSLPQRTQLVSTFGLIGNTAAAGCIDCPTGGSCTGFFPTSSVLSPSSAASSSTSANGTKGGASNSTRTSRYGGLEQTVVDPETTIKAMSGYYREEDCLKPALANGESPLVFRACSKPAYRCLGAPNKVIDTSGAWPSSTASELKAVMLEKSESPSSLAWKMLGEAGVTRTRQPITSKEAGVMLAKPKMTTVATLNMTSNLTTLSNATCGDMDGPSGASIASVSDVDCGRGFVYDRSQANATCQGPQCLVGVGDGMGFVDSMTCCKLCVNPLECEVISYAVLSTLDFGTNKSFELPCNYGYTGSLCLACRPGFAPQGARCQLCADRSLLVFLAVLAVIIATVGTVFMISQSLKANGVNRAIGIDLVKICYVRKAKRVNRTRE